MEDSTSSINQMASLSHVLGWTPHDAQKLTPTEWQLLIELTLKRMKPLLRHLPVFGDTTNGDTIDRLLKQEFLTPAESCVVWKGVFTNMLVLHRNSRTLRLLEADIDHDHIIRHQVLEGEALLSLLETDPKVRQWGYIIFSALTLTMEIGLKKRRAQLGPIEQLTADLVDQHSRLDSVEGITDPMAVWVR